MRSARQCFFEVHNSFTFTIHHAYRYSEFYGSRWKVAQALRNPGRKPQLLKAAWVAFRIGSPILYAAIDAMYACHSSLPTLVNVYDARGWKAGVRLFIRPSSNSQ